VPTPSISPALRTEALEQLLTERGLIDPEVMDGIITEYEIAVGPLNGAKVVAKAWTNAEYRQRLLLVPLITREAMVGVAKVEAP
jgi:nitrile hydratase subunit alpha